MLESVFNKVLQKETPTQVFSCEYCKISKNIFFIEHLRWWSGSSIICGWISVPEDTSTQVTSEFIKCKHWLCRKIKTTVFFMWPASWRTDISSFYYSDINLLLINYACCKLCNIWLLLFENNSSSYRYTGASHWRKTLVQLLLKIG